MGAHHAGVDERRRLRPDARSRSVVSWIASVLLALAAVAVIVFGMERTVYWLSGPLGAQFGAGEVFGTAVGMAMVAIGAGIGFAARAVWRDSRVGWIAAAVLAGVLGLSAFVALSTPGPPPMPVPLSAAAALVALTLGSAVIARAVVRGGP